MTNPSTITRGNIQGSWVLAVTLTPASVANATAAEQTFTITGVLLGDQVSVNKPSNQNGLSIANTRVSANGVIAIAFANASSATITPTSEMYSIEVNRPENVTAGVSALTQIVS